MGRVLRSELRSALCAEVQAWQSGAIPGGSTEQPSHVASLFIRQARAAGHSAALLFTDVRAAFYSAWPELVVGPLLQPAQRQAIFDATGLAPAQREEYVS